MTPGLESKRQRASLRSHTLVRPAVALTTLLNIQHSPVCEFRSVRDLASKKKKKKKKWVVPEEWHHCTLGHL